MEYNRLAESDSFKSHLNEVHVDDSNENRDYICQSCKSKQTKKQPTTHKSNDCFNYRCQVLEHEVIRLKEHDSKSRLQIKELQSKIETLESALKVLSLPKQEQAAPYSFGSGFKLRHETKRSNPTDILNKKGDINYDNILQTKRANSREHVGLFGSLGAASQHH